LKLSVSVWPDRLFYVDRGEQLELRRKLNYKKLHSSYATVKRWCAGQ